MTKGARKEPGAGKRSKQTRPRKEIRGRRQGARGERVTQKKGLEER